MNNALTSFNPLGKRQNFWGITAQQGVSLVNTGVNGLLSWTTSNNNTKAAQAQADAQIKIAEAQSQNALTDLEKTQITLQAQKELAATQAQANQKLALYGLGALVFLGGIYAILRK